MSVSLSKVAYVGHVLSAPRMVEAVYSWPTPATLQELKSFLGLASYYRRYVKDFAYIAAPLVQLTQKSSRCVGFSCQNAFQLLKEKPNVIPILSYPRFSVEAPPFHLLTDAGASGLGVVLE